MNEEEYTEGKQELLLAELQELEDTLAQWNAWLVLNEGAFTPEQLSRCLTRARQIVNEILLAEIPDE